MKIVETDLDAGVDEGLGARGPTKHGQGDGRSDGELDDDTNGGTRDGRWSDHGAPCRERPASTSIATGWPIRRRDVKMPFMTTRWARRWFKSSVLLGAVGLSLGACEVKAPPASESSKSGAAQAMAPVSQPASPGPKGATVPASNADKLGAPLG